jgi:hypothetical protein
MIVVHQVIVQPVVHTEIVTHVRHRAQLPIAANAVTVHVTRVQVQIAQPVVRMEIVTHVQVHAQVLIVHVAKIHTVVIAHAQAMIAMPVRLRVTANAVADQIAPEVVSPMIAKNVHVVALAKSA